MLFRSFYGDSGGDRRRLEGVRGCDRPVAEEVQGHQDGVAREAPFAAGAVHGVGRGAEEAGGRGEGSGHEGEPVDAAARRLHADGERSDVERVHGESVPQGMDGQVRESSRGRHDDLRHLLSNLKQVGKSRHHVELRNQLTFQDPCHLDPLLAYLLFPLQKLRCSVYPYV